MLQKAENTEKMKEYKSRLWKYKCIVIKSRPKVTLRVDVHCSVKTAVDPMEFNNLSAVTKQSVK